MIPPNVPKIRNGLVLLIGLGGLNGKKSEQCIICNISSGSTQTASSLDLDKSSAAFCIYM